MRAHLDIRIDINAHAHIQTVMHRHTQALTWTSLPEDEEEEGGKEEVEGEDETEEKGE